jgi:hemerythrin-like domain-containing protein
VIEQAMRALQGMCIRLRAGGSVPAVEMAKLLDFIQGFADGFHHAKEETYLFPALEQAGIRNEHGPLAFLSNEHETERKLLGELELAVADYRRDLAAAGKFVSAALLYKDHLIGHMQHEDATLFRLAEEVLDDQVKDALIRAFTPQNAKDRETTLRYERLAEELEKAGAV